MGKKREKEWKRERATNSGGGGTRWQYNNMIIRRAAPVFCSSCRRFGGSDRNRRGRAVLAEVVHCHGWCW
ncbi:hypothetical protein K0M31_016185 [Melipona bicolor]|uniref:Uncharacterized protein n=1 Tax=Melipona bicolor TaxID=60889 RepID=A0AA40KTC5_9HYME|nr:hypothetical protein K0M31_016185 [Melipona bicolor]